MRNDEFVHLHVHTEYSLLDGACTIKKYLEKIKSMGQKAAAITDHGNMYGVAEFYSEAVSMGIKPIIGCEVYVAPRRMTDKEANIDSRPYHLILLCENYEGYRNLIKLVSAAGIDGFYGKPRVDRELLKKYHSGLICLSACLSGELSRLILDGNYEQARNAALMYKEIFGENNYFIEIQRHGLENEEKVIPSLLRISADTGIPLAATNDCHYIDKSDAEIQQILMCVQTGKKLSDPDAMSFGSDEFYVKSTQEMNSIFRDHEDALINTSVIAERCNAGLHFGNTMLPEFVIPEVKDNDEYFRQLCRKGMYEKYGSNPDKKITERLEYELSVITEMKFTDYFLIVWDFIRYARVNNVPVGPGRGSGAGSLCAYCIGITGIDPMKFDLLFERFLNPERVSMPDFDIDFCIEGRQSVKDYVTRKYGKERVSEIIAFDTMKARAAVRDVGRVMDVSYQLTDKAAKLIDPKLTIDEALSTSEELNTLYQSDRTVHRLIDYAKKLEGMPRHTSIHAAGVVISAVPLNEVVPLQKSDNTIITQYTMKYLEKLGLLKMDFLGLRNLTIIRDAVNEIKKTEADFDINKIPFDDRAVFSMLSEGDTAGVFQFESDGMTQKLIELSPERLEDLIVVLSLYRPGPMKSIPMYIENKKHPEKVKYAHPVLKEILSDTYGIMVYQEQVMEICRKLAGFTYGHADEVRRAMAKKKMAEMLKERESFISGAVSNGVPQSVAEKIFSEMESFASYAFNKSHAAAYAYLAYQTAYLKCHYRGIYMAALMSSVMSYPSKLSEYIGDCRRKGIQILRPDINMSVRNFHFTGGKMYFGLNAIKNVGEGLCEKIIKNRNENGIYRSLQNFCERLEGRELNKKALEYLIRSGAFDDMGLNRRQMLENSDRLLEMAGSGNAGFIDGQLGLFGADSSVDMEYKIPFVREFSSRQLYAMEKDAVGVYLTGSPISEYDYVRKLFRTVKAGSIQNNTEIKDGEKIRLIGIIESRRDHVTKKGERMCFLNVTDGTGELDAVVFPDLYSISGSKLNEGSVVYISGKTSVKEESVSVICGVIAEESEFGRLAENYRLCIKTRSDDKRIMNELIELCRKFQGNTELCFWFNDMNKLLKPKKQMKIAVNRDSFSALSELFGEVNTGFITE